MIETNTANQKVIHFLQEIGHKYQFLPSFVQIVMYALAAPIEQH